MSVKLNQDKSIVDEIRKSLKENDGYCPCRIEKIPDNKGMCKEFRDQIKDSNFEGYCHCTLYYKSLD